MSALWQPSRPRGAYNRLLLEQGFEALLLSAEGRVEACNPAAAALLDMPEAGLLGRPLADLFADPAVIDLANAGGVDAVVGTSGHTIPVRLLARDVESGLRVFALRDRRAELAAAATLARLFERDALTGLPDRNAFLAALEETMADRPDDMFLLSVDLDHFHAVNDALGFATGDLVLKRAAGRCGAALCATDRMFRTDGDSFAILTTQDPGTTAARMVASMAAPFLVAGQVIDSGATVGIAALAGFRSADEVRRAADLALHAAKAAGRGRHVFFDPHADDRFRDRRQLEVDLKLAHAARRLDLAFQPLVTAGSGHIIGCEALLRWPHESRGAVSPAQFVPIAESIGLIGEIGAWALERAILAILPLGDGFKLSVNVSPRQLIDGQFAPLVATLLRQTGLDPARLELEITESALIDGKPDVLETLQQIRQQGVGLALDDFGTGFSSLSTVARYPFSRLKIDRAFIRDAADGPRPRAVARGIAALARALGLSITAEGVETDWQARFATGLGCDTLQGYLFGKPMPAAELAGLVASRRPTSDGKTS
jgi:diguanylate cyclase (GGDEF)-like protein